MGSAAVCLFLLSACTGSATPSRVAASAAASSTFANLTDAPSSAPKPHRFVTVGDIELVSPQLMAATMQRCRREGGTTCRSELLISEDLGRSWTRVTPPIADPAQSNLGPPVFLDAEHGWIVADNCVGGHADLFRTIDGARSWNRTAIVGSSCNAGAGVFPSFPDAGTGYLTHLEPTGASADLSTSGDGGLSWSRPQELPFPGVATFTTAQDGWLIGDRFGGPAQALRTTDGGSTWRRIDVPDLRHVTALAEPRSTGDTGVLPVTIAKGGRWEVEFLTTRDSGKRWHRGPVVRIGRPSDERRVVTGIAGPDTWWVAGSDGQIVRTSDAGASWHPTAPASAISIVELVPLDADRALAIQDQGRRRILAFTGDGGRTWRNRTPEISRNGAVSTSLVPVAEISDRIDALLPGPDGSILALAGEGGLERARIWRIDPSDGSWRASQALRADPSRKGPFARVGGSVWLASGPSAPAPVLYRLDERSLTKATSVPVPATVVGLAATPAGLWVGTGQELVLVDPSDGSTIRTIPIGGHLTHLAADPSGQRLYVSTDSPIDDHDHVRFVEVDATTGEVVVAASDIGFADLGGPSGLVATDEGVWVATPTGMMGTLTFRRASDLRQTATYRPGGSNGISASSAGGTLWVPDGQGALICADPVTGAVRGTVGLPGMNLAATNVVASATGLYVGNDRTLELIRYAGCG